MFKSKLGVFLGILLSIKLFALETVNLIKCHSFEKNSEVWLEYAGGDGDLDSAVANRHDSERAFTGFFSATSDTRKEPGDYTVGYDDSALIIQQFVLPKTVSDLDSLTIRYSLFTIYDFNMSSNAFVAIYVDPEKTAYWSPGYSFKCHNLDEPVEVEPRKILKVFDFPIDSLWYELGENVRSDLEGNGIPTDTRVDSFSVMGWGIAYPNWRGQKIFWDDIRLMGYADYDVGVKEIISEASLTVGTPYVPMARIKNFGRENADSFLVIAVIEDSSAIVYVDTLPWSLAADTEDPVSFAEFIPFHPFERVLTVYTVMTPDESDADDRLSLNLFCSVCQDSPEFPGISMELLNPITPNYLRVSYALSVGQLGIISVYDAAGRIQDRMNVRGVSEITITADLIPGVYFIRLDAGEESVTHKAVLLL